MQFSARHLLATASLAATLVFSLPAAAAPESYTFDPNHTNIYWHASHFGFSTPSGKFGDIGGTVVLDEAKPDASTVEFTIKTTSIVTGIPLFDEHLRSEKFFNSEKFTTATFKSTKVVVTGEKTAKVTGDFTLLGVTKPITLDVTLNKIGTSMAHPVKTAGFSATTTIKRSEFGMGFGTPGVSDEVPITIEAEAKLSSGKMEINNNGSSAADKKHN